MIVGNGDLAQALKEIDRDDRIFFCSGVSNSREVRESEFQREKDLLWAIKDRKHLVYFSSLAVFYSKTPYADHKRMMERIVKNFPRWTIVRLGNIDWGTNPCTIINFMRAQKAKGEPLEIQDTYRYIVNREEFLYWVKMIPAWNCEMSIVGRRLTVQQIVDEYVNAKPLA